MSFSISEELVEHDILSNQNNLYMSKFELGLHLGLLIDAIPMPDALRRRLESPPDSFDTSDAIARLLAGEDPSIVFQQEVKPFLNRNDLKESYIEQRSRFFNHDWKKKALVNTLRSAACLSIQTELMEKAVQLGLPTPELNTRAQWPLIFARRTVEVTSSVKILAHKLNTPQSDSTFEKVLALLNGYLKTSTESVRTDILYRVGEEATGITRRFLPAYFHLIFKIIERDSKNFEALSDHSHTLDFYQQLCLNSQGILLRGASTDIARLSAYMEETVVYGTPDDILFFLREECFELHKRSTHKDNDSGFVVRLKPEISKKIKETREHKLSGRTYRVMLTKCPAVTRDRHTGESLLETAQENDTIQPDINLLESVIHKVTLG